MPEPENKPRRCPWRQVAKQLSARTPTSRRGPRRARSVASGGGARTRRGASPAGSAPCPSSGRPSGSSTRPSQGSTLTRFRRSARQRTAVGTGRRCRGRARRGRRTASPGPAPGESRRLPPGCRGHLAPPEADGRQRRHVRLAHRYRPPGRTVRSRALQSAAARCLATRPDAAVARSRVVRYLIDDHQSH